MLIKFYKYHGTGNDFIMVDNRPYNINKDNTEMVARLCHRHFGIGADGLILLNMADGYDFEMVYFNSDGNESSMCGNGGRCLVSFAHQLGLIEHDCRFKAIDGDHTAHIDSFGIVTLGMKDVTAVNRSNNDFILNTGSPHYVQFVKGVKHLDIVHNARAIRYNATYQKEGINVNFVEVTDEDEIMVRTYERGVEDETLSCGTGVVASAIAFAQTKHNLLNEVRINTLGGHLRVNFDANGENYTNVKLVGPAVKVFEGQVEI
jgi:diaminopimelate epimerase